MEAKQLIKEKIIESAKQKADSILAHAKQECAKNLLVAENDILKKREDAFLDAQRQAHEIVLQGEMMANLESRKIILKEKRTLIDRVFSDAAKAIFEMSDKEYAKFMHDVVIKHIENNDEIVICALDKSRLDKKWLDDIAKSKGVKIRLSSDYHNEKGGVILKGNNCDKKLTIESLIKEVYDRVEGTVVKKLFG